MKEPIVSKYDTREPVLKILNPITASNTPIAHTNNQLSIWIFFSILGSSSNAFYWIRNSLAKLIFHVLFVTKFLSANFVVAAVLHFMTSQFFAAQMT